jgi:hypothetical protein
MADQVPDAEGDECGRPTHDELARTGSHRGPPVDQPDGGADAEQGKRASTIAVISPAMPEPKT